MRAHRSKPESHFLLLIRAGGGLEAHLIAVVEDLIHFPGRQH
jgi:hypothetical protein